MREAFKDLYLRVLSIMDSVCKIKTICHTLKYRAGWKRISNAVSSSRGDNVLFYSRGSFIAGCYRCPHFCLIYLPTKRAILSRSWQDCTVGTDKTAWRFFSLLSPSAVRSHGAIKRERPYQGHSIGFSQSSEVSCRCDIFRNVLPLIRHEINVKNPIKKIDISVRISKFAVWMYLKYVLKSTPLGKILTIKR